MKISKIITSSLLISLLGISTAIGVTSNTKEVSNAATETTVYYAVPKDVVGTYNVKLNVKLQSEYDNWATYDMERDGYKTQGGKELYKCTYTDLYDGVAVMQFQLYNGSSYVSQQQPIGSWASASTYNGKVYVHDTGWQEYNPEETYYTVSRYKVLTETAGGWDKDGPYLIDELIVPAGYELDLNYGVYVEGREWNKWHSDPNLSDTITGTLVVENDVSIYGEYVLCTRYPIAYQLDLTLSGWENGEADYAIMVFNEYTYKPAAIQWSEYLENVPAGQKAIRIPIEMNFDAACFTVVRYNKDNTKEAWEQDRWANVWNQTADDEIGTECSGRISNIVENNKNIVYHGVATVYTQYGQEWYPDYGLRTLKTNGSNNAEFYGEVEFEEETAFKIALPLRGDEMEYFTNFTLDSSVSGCFHKTEAGNIYVDEPGSYSFYFDTTTYNLYITSGGYADAESWCQDFIDGVGCDASGVNLPKHWDTYAYTYRNYLSKAGKNIIYAASANPFGTIIEHAVARYEIAVRSHPTIDRFITDGSGNVRPVASNNISSILVGLSKDNNTFIIIATTIIAISGLTFFYVYKGRKEY